MPRKLFFDSPLHKKFKENCWESEEEFHEKKAR
jgi:hypothetical protein